MHIPEAIPGVLGNREIRAFISGAQGNKGLKMRVTGEQRQFGNIGKQDFDSWEAIYFKGTAVFTNLFLSKLFSHSVFKTVIHGTE